MNLGMVGVLIYAVQFAFTAKSRSVVDFDAITLPFFATLILAVVAWETMVIFDFLIKDVKGQVVIDPQRLTIIKGNEQEILNRKDLVKIELAGPRDGSKSVTARWTYAKLTFKSRVLFVTSLTMENEEIQKEFGLVSSNTLFRGRRYFELIK